MSESPILEYWPEGIAAARIPANNNVRLLQALKINPAISATTAAQPGSPTEGDVYILPASPTGAQWAGFFEGDVVIFYNATWTAYTPIDGLRKFVEDEGEDWQYIGDSSGGWAPAGGGGGAVDSVNGQTGIVALDAADVGAVASVVAGTNVTVDNTDPQNPIVSSTATGGSPAGSTTQIQYNNAGAFGAEAAFTYDASTNTQTVENVVLSGKINEFKGSNIASATTTDIGAATGNLVHITGTTTITGLGTVQAGTRRVVVFDGILTLTHNATSLILPTGANITTAAGDSAILVSEGSGNWKCVVYQKADGTALTGGGGLTGFTSALNTASPNGPVNVSSITASGGTTDQAAALVAKGAGPTLAQIPDGTATAGNVRGQYATDLQKLRNTNTMVASGTNAVIPGGQNNTASGNFSFAMGSGCTASGNSTFSMGNNCTATQNYAASFGNTCTATATYAFATGFGAGASGSASVSMGESTTASGTHSQALGSNTVANANYSLATGQYASAKLVIGASARASYRFANTGDAQSREFQLSSDTTNATPEAVTSNNSTAATTNQVVLENNSAFVVKGTVVARQNTTGDSKSWEFTAHIRRGANAAATAMVAAATVTGIAADAGAAAWAIAITADTTNGCLKIEVTGEAAKNLRWTTHVYSCNELQG